MSFAAASLLRRGAATALRPTFGRRAMSGDAAEAAIEMANGFQDDLRSIQSLHRRKLVSDTYWNTVLGVKEEVQAEINQVHAEARALKAGWEKVIMQQAMQMLRHKKALEEKAAAERSAAVERLATEREAELARDRARSCLRHDVEAIRTEHQSYDYLPNEGRRAAPPRKFSHEVQGCQDACQGVGGGRHLLFLHSLTMNAAAGQLIPSSDAILFADCGLAQDCQNC